MDFLLRSVVHGWLKVKKTAVQVCSISQRDQKGQHAFSKTTRKGSASTSVALHPSKKSEKIKLLRPGYKMSMRELKILPGFNKLS